MIHLSRHQGFVILFAVLFLAIGIVLGATLCYWWQSRVTPRQAHFFSFVAHEINTPVTSLNMTVLNFIQETFGPIPQALQPWMQLLRSDIVRLVALVNDFRDFIHFKYLKDFV